MRTYHFRDQQHQSKRRPHLPDRSGIPPVFSIFRPFVVDK